MKSITFVRHGKSSWDLCVSDRERPLNQRGIDDAKRIGEFLDSQGVTPKAVYASPACRALSTCRLIMEALTRPHSSIKITENLYDFEGYQVRQFINQLPQDIDNVMIFGHNNAFTNLINELSDASIDNLPTAGVATIESEANSWSSIKRGKLTLFITPKKLYDAR